MRIRKAQLPEEVLRMISLYRNKDLIDIKKIKAYWACGVNQEYAMYIPSNFEEYSVFYVNLKKLINLAEFGEMMHEKMNPQYLFTEIYERDFRIVKVLDRWNKKEYIDPPELGLDYQGKIIFHDGRHRTVVAFHIGEKEIPVMIHSSVIDKISQLIYLKEKAILLE